MSQDTQTLVKLLRDLSVSLAVPNSKRSEMLKESKLDQTAFDLLAQLDELHMRQATFLPLTTTMEEKIQAYAKAFEGKTLSQTQVDSFSRVVCFLKETSLLLSIGGDDRIMVHAENYNLTDYLSSTSYRPNIIRRGSSTCSNVTKETYDYADRIKNDFIQSILNAPSSKEVIESLQRDMVGSLKALIDVPDTRVVLFPSGSDAEYLPMLIGLIRSHSILQKMHGSDCGTENVCVHNYITAAGEVGTYTAQASSGTHFCSFSPYGQALTPGEYLAGMKNTWVKIVPYRPRDETGKVDLLEKELLQDIRSFLDRAAHHVAVVHLVCGSKTGIIYPSMAVIKQLTTEYADRVVIAADACQFRCRMNQVREYLNDNFIVLITSSKFYTAPPFCSAVLLPRSIADELERYSVAVTEKGIQHVLFKGLAEYINAFDISSDLAHFRAYINAQTMSPWFNFGLHLRWRIGLQVMQEYHALPENLVRKFTILWTNHARELFAACTPHLTALQDQFRSDADSSDQYRENIGACNSIISFSVHVRNSSAPLKTLSFLEHREFRRRLTLLVTGDSRALLTDEQDVQVVETQALLGQPVLLAGDLASDKQMTILRFALGADMVIRAIRPALDQLGDTTDYDTKLSVLERELETAFSNAQAVVRQCDISSTALHENIFYTNILQMLREDARIIRRMHLMAIHWNGLQASDFKHELEI